MSALSLGEIVEVVDMATAIRRKCQVLAFNYANNPEALGILSQLAVLDSPTLEQVDRVLRTLEVPLASTFRSEFYGAYGYHWVRGIPTGAYFHVTLSTLIRVIHADHPGETRDLHSGVHNLQVRQVTVIEGKDEKAYPWLVDRAGWGMHLGAWYEHTWNSGIVTLTRL